MLFFDSKVATVRPFLLLGGASHEQDYSLLRSAGVTHILQVGAELRPTFPDRFAYARVSIEDAEQEDIIRHLPRCHKFIDSALRPTAGSRDGDAGCADCVADCEGGLATCCCGGGSAVAVGRQRLVRPAAAGPAGAATGSPRAPAARLPGSHDGKNQAAECAADCEGGLGTWHGGAGAGGTVAAVPAGGNGGGGGPVVLVHCAAGMSRSATVVISYLMVSERLPYDTAFRDVKSARPCVFPNLGFLLQLWEWEAGGCDCERWAGWSKERFAERLAEYRRAQAAAGLHPAVRVRLPMAPPGAAQAAAQANRPGGDGRVAGAAAETEAAGASAPAAGAAGPIGPLTASPSGVKVFACV